MEEIKVGEYVRIDNDFRLIALGIGKVIKTNKDTICVKMNFEMPFSFKIENITKHSKNIINLIEVGDIIEINKEKYEVIYDESFDKLGILIPTKDGIRHSSIEYLVMENLIESIVTKEQVAENCYVVKEN